MPENKSSVPYVQELLPGRVGLVSGMFFGFAFGIAGIAAAVLGLVANHFGHQAVAVGCSFLPLLGLLTVLLPRVEEPSPGRSLPGYDSEAFAKLRLSPFTYG